ncbi:MAG: redox-sensing transcriptional repressor Rex [Acidimicrobiia bacterium]|nr:redox-sensing transcriptional repressor Rex [Acidimicrobiia bacterium]
MKGTIPRATVKRLPLYLQVLEDLPPAERTVSSGQLARAAGVKAANVRKDLSFLGSNGVRGVGYDAAQLRNQIARKLGRMDACPVAIIGAGNLGQALSGYPGFIDRGFEVAGLFDVDASKVGATYYGIVVESVDGLEKAIEQRGVSIGIITTVPAAAQDIADRLAAAGIRSILNFAAVTLEVPEGVEVRRVDLSTELQILSYYLHESA